MNMSLTEYRFAVLNYPKQFVTAAIKRTGSKPCILK